MNIGWSEKLTRVTATVAALSIGCCLSLFADDLRVTQFKQLNGKANRPAWGSNNLIAYDGPGPSGFFDVYTMNPDGSNVVCLTCSVTTLPVGSKGDPDWRPQADFLAIQVQTVTFSTGTPGYVASFPGGGWGSDLFIMDSAGKNYYQITHASPDPTNHLVGGVLHPRFSHDGTKLVWVQAVPGSNAPDSNTGTSRIAWNLMLGDFAVTNGVPAVSNIQSLSPCASNTVFCETGDFSLDDSTIFFTGVLSGQQWAGMDIYSFNLSTQTLTNLTNSPNNWDELPRVLPNQNKVVWIHGSGSNNYRALMTDYWMMDYDGGNKLQLTFYNNANASQLGWNSLLGSSGGVAVAEHAWSPDGTQLVGQVTQNGVSANVGGGVYQVQVETAAPTLSGASYARPPLGQDSIISTFSTDLAAASMNATGSTLPTNLDGTAAVLTDSAGTMRNVPLFFVSAGQVNWLVPPGTATGPATLQVTNPQGQSVRATVDIEATGPGLFAITGTGQGPGVGALLTYSSPPVSGVYTQQNIVNSSGDLNSLTLSGNGMLNYLVLYGTGFRHYQGAVTVQIGGQTLPVYFTGAQGSFVGLDQLNVLVPDSFAGSGVQNVTVTVDGVVSNAVQVQFQ